MNVPARQPMTAPQQINLTSLVRGLQKGDARTQSAALATAQAILSTPASAEWIAGRMVTLLSHGYQAGQSVKVSAEAGRDWIAVLSKYPQCVIEEAALEWIRKKTHKPAPAHMVEICERHLRRITSVIPKQSAPPPPVNRVSGERAQQIRDAWKPLKTFGGAA